MKYFTPEAYIAYNSDDAVEAASAEDYWESAIESYRKELDAILPTLPPSARRLATMNLHDWELAIAWVSHAPQGAGEVATVALRRGDEVAEVTYRLWANPGVERAPHRWRFAGRPVRWLYDEIEAEPGAPKCFRHRILLSSGETLVVPFKTASVLTAKSVLTQAGDRAAAPALTVAAG
jgi:hypothetical protein